MITTTTTRQAGWQHTLTELLDRANRERLPLIAWVLHSADGVLIGRCCATDPAQRRADWETWCRALGAVAQPPEWYGDSVHLRAAAIRPGDGPKTEIVISALCPPSS
ncbi:hypothetical protein [Plantactinospora endophytica]|uniref:Uncharacterized protein n=1 Tax=Plantactinospora endophytica TaxID=673535 RepID=A0ABQ4E8H2_9ACTN|nr:hypothetical protein [Plantactinospora endophytica]GIG91027.1 hypothetical protein Pen02_59630 [Plantactinospora endophytica]